MLILLLILFCESSPAVAEFKELYTWNQLNWNFPSKGERNKDIDSSKYDEKHGLPIGFLKWKDRVFITAPRWTDWKEDVPATLNTVPLNEGPDPTSPVLDPYPDWSWHLNLEKCEGIASVFRLIVDKSDRLWVVDNGFYMNGDRVCPPQLLIFDSTDKLESRETFPEHVLSSGSIIINIELDYNSKKDELFAYFVDVNAFALIVYDAKKKRFWRIKHNYFYPDPFAGDNVINGIRFQLMDGIFGITLSPSKKKEGHQLYFNPWASFRVFYVPTKVLKNENSSQDSGYFDSFHYLDNLKQSQSTVIAMDKNGVLFYSLLSPPAVACWNWETPFRPDQQPIIDNDPTTLEFIAEMRIFDDELWILTNRFPKFYTGVIDWNDTNFRILTVRIEDAIKGTICEGKSNETGVKDKFRQKKTCRKRRRHPLL